MILEWRWSRILTHCVRLTTLCKCLLRTTAWIARRTTNSRLVLRFASYWCPDDTFWHMWKTHKRGTQPAPGNSSRIVRLARLWGAAGLQCSADSSVSYLLLSTFGLGLLHSCTTPLRATAVAFSVSLGSRTYTRIQRSNTIRSKKVWKETVNANLKYK